jgi:hypothetical protein
LLGQRNKLNTEGTKVFQRSKQVGYRTGEAVELPNDDYLEFPLVCISNQTVKFGTTFLCAGDASIYVLADKPPSATEAVLSYLSGL